MGVAFPEGYSNWQETDLHDLIDAELITEPTDKNVVRARAQGRQGGRRGRDRDRLRPRGRADRPRGAEPGARRRTRRSPARVGTRPPVKRARYSALTKEEIERAFSELDELSYDLAYAGAARQDIDLIWGATLTRAVSLATRRFGSNFLSVGRVQSPTLALIVERELERRAHVPEALLGGVREVRASRGRLRGAPRHRQVLGARGGRRRARRRPRAPASSRRSARGGTSASRRPPTTPPPSPPTPRAGSGSRPRNAMRIAEDLYMDGFISYPRTDNTVYPPLAEHARAGLLAGHGPRLLRRGAAARRRPDRDPGQEGDHRPPADPPDPGAPPGALEGPKRRVYELVVAALPRHLLRADDHRVDARRHRGGLGDYFVRGSRRRRPGLRRRSTPTRARPTTRSRSSRRASRSTSTATRGSSTRRPSRRRGSARAS